MTWVQVLATALINCVARESHQTLSLTAYLWMGKMIPTSSDCEHLAHAEHIIGI